MPALLTLLLLAAPAAPSPNIHRFTHRLGGAPVGEVELRVDPDHYVYLSRHFFRRGKSSEERFAPDAAYPPDAPAWASLSLLTPRPVGCWKVASELTLQQGEACVTAVGPVVSGTLLGKPFTARYLRGQLQQLTLGESDFVRSSGPAEFKDPFGEGFEISSAGTGLALRPPLEGVRSADPTGAGSDEDCVGAAKAWLARHGGGWELVLGLIEDDGRGWPHAWVRNRATGEELDPSRPAAAPVRARYLALPTERAAETYLELLGKRRALVRVGSR